MVIEYIKTYGVRQGYNKGKQRFFVVDTGRTTSLHYANYDFAMRQAESFVKSCYKDFIDFNGNQAKFIFKKMEE